MKIVGGRTIHTEGVDTNFRNGFILTFNSDQGYKVRFDFEINKRFF